MAKCRSGYFQIRLNRHAHALPGQVDHERVLSDIGAKQTKAAKKRYKTALLRGINHVFSSPATRCTGTAQAVLNERVGLIKIIESLMPFGGPLDKAFKQYGYDVNGYAGDAEVHTLMTLYGQVATEETVGDLLRNGFEPKHGDTVVIFGHAIVLNYMALALSVGLRVADKLPSMSLLRRRIEEAGEIRMKFRLDGTFVGYRMFG